jgi:hypothetical protein
MAGCSFGGTKPDFAAEAAEWQRLTDATLAPSLFHTVEPMPNAGRAS